MKIHPISRMRKVWEWLRDPPEKPNARGTTILMWLLVFGGYGAGLLADNRAEADARHQAVCVVRLALGGLYDYAEELQGPTPEISEARARLDATIPDDGC